jgi:hypothetical protein
LQHIAIGSHRQRGADGFARRRTKADHEDLRPRFFLAARLPDGELVVGIHDEFGA